MTDVEFIERVLAIRERPVTQLEKRWHDVHCAQDYDHVYMARLHRLVTRYQSERES